MYGIFKKLFVQAINTKRSGGNSCELALPARERLLDFLIDPSSIIRYADVNSRFVRSATMLTPAGYSIQSESS